MRRRAIGVRPAAAALVVATALALAACGSSSTTEATGGAKAGGAKAGGAAKHADPRESSCQAQVGGFVHSLATLRRRLVAGLTYQQYVSEMRAIRSTYEAIPVAKLEVTCLNKVGGPAERSFNTYLEAGTDWGECVGTPGCEAATVEPVLQRRWRLAAKALNEAEAALAASHPTGP